MTTLYIVIGLIVILYLFNKLQNKNISQITTSNLKTLLDAKKSDHMFIDVRTPGEFKSRKIKAFKNIPLDQIKSRINQIPEDKTIVLICQSGSRSSSAARLLSKSGYKNVLNVRGGMGAWH